MTPPKHELVVQDCDDAIKLDSKYIKALNRRAIALEHLERYEEALRGKSMAYTQFIALTCVLFLTDFTAAAILDRLVNHTTTAAVERVLKALATNKAKEIMLVGINSHSRRNIILTVACRTANQDCRPLHLFPPTSLLLGHVSPWSICISSTFHLVPGEHPQLPETPSTGDNTLKSAFEALDAADYPHAVSLVNEAIEQGVSWDDGKAEAYNLRGTFKYVFRLLTRAHLHQSL